MYQWYFLFQVQLDRLTVHTYQIEYYSVKEHSLYTYDIAIYRHICIYICIVTKDATLNGRRFDNAIPLLVVLLIPECLIGLVMNTGVLT